MFNLKNITFVKISLECKKSLHLKIEAKMAVKFFLYSNVHQNISDKDLDVVRGGGVHLLDIVYIVALCLLSTFYSFLSPFYTIRASSLPFQLKNNTVHTDLCYLCM
jgi:hypothetical protein